MEEMEYTGPDEEQVYVRFNKVSKLSEIYQNTNQECGFRHEKTITAREKLSTSLSDLRLAPKLVTAMVETICDRVYEVKKQEKVVQNACLYAGMERLQFFIRASIFHFFHVCIFIIIIKLACIKGFFFLGKILCIVLVANDNIRLTRARR
jgi:hypothetical protein